MVQARSKTKIEDALKQEFSPQKWCNLTTLGEPDPANITKSDLLSAMAFDKQGQMLAVGDRGGRIIIFQRSIEDKQIEFDYLTEFQSHEVAFDPLNS